jgi:hypothetical protein
MTSIPRRTDAAPSGQRSGSVTGARRTRDDEEAP